MTRQTFSKRFGGRARIVAASAMLVAGLAGATALAQGQPQGLPAGHPPLDVPPGQNPAQLRGPGPGGVRPMQGRPGQGRPGQGLQLGQGRGPGFGQGQPGRPGFPPGFQRPQPRVVAPAHAEPESGGHGGGHCPGHGPHDAPHFDQINWWHGMIGVNNEKAVQPDFFSKLLWRYENHTDHCDPKNEAPPFLASLLNLGVLAFILYRFGKKPIGEALVKRKQSIMSDIDNASRLKSEAQARLDEYEGKFEQMAETLEALKAEYAAQAELEKKHVIAEAEERRTRMRRDAEFRIEQELRTARIELMHEAVQEATVAAEEIIRKRAAQADLDRMSEEYLGSLRDALGPSASDGGSR